MKLLIYQIHHSCVLVQEKGDFLAVVDALNRLLVVQFIHENHQLLKEHWLWHILAPENKKIFQSFIRSAVKSRTGTILELLRFEELEKELIN
jgi:hypothetical protein